MSYLECPKCGMKFHEKSVKCPKCNITPEEHHKQVALDKKKSKEKAEKKKARDLSRSSYCTACGEVFKNPKLITKGSLGIEIILWVCFLIPGVIYSIWRHTSRYKGCPACRSAAIIPANSPNAAKALGNA